MTRSDEEFLPVGKLPIEHLRSIRVSCLDRRLARMRPSSTSAGAFRIRFRTRWLAHPAPDFRHTISGN